MKLNKLLPSLALVVALWSGPCTALSCWEFLAYAKQVMGETLDVNSGHIESGPTVLPLLTQARPGKYGKIIPLQLIGTVWPSGHEEAPNAPQGDPRNFIAAFGFQTAAFFQFRMVNRKLVEIPNFVEFSNLIADLNQELRAMDREEIAVQFYPADGEVGPRIYNPKFAKYLAIPMATRANALLHDLSFHAPALLLPRKLLVHAARQTQLLLQYLDYLKQMAKGEIPNTTGLEPAQIVRAVRVMDMHRTYQIDSLTANFSTAAYTLNKPNQLEEVHKLIAGQLQQTLLNGAGGPDFLRKFLVSAMENPQPKFFSQWSTRRWKWLFGGWSRPIQKEELVDLVRAGSRPLVDFLERRTPRPEDAVEYTDSPDKLCKALQMKRKDIALAARRIMLREGDGFKPPSSLGDRFQTELRAAGGAPSDVEGLFEINVP